MRFSLTIDAGNELYKFAKAFIDIVETSETVYTTKNGGT